MQFRYTSLNKVDILNSEKDIWPPEDQRDLWKYEPCPPDVEPLVGQKFLMHIWRNPHHADRVIYADWQKNASHWQHRSEWIRHLFTPKDLIPDLEVQEQVKRSAYVFVKIPKKVGEQLEPTYGDHMPAGWGLVFEEGFKVHRLLVVVLFFYFIVSMAAIIWVIRKYGATGPTTGAGLFGVLSWFTSFSALLMTVWFKWAESS